MKIHINLHEETSIVPRKAEVVIETNSHVVFTLWSDPAVFPNHSMVIETQYEATRVLVPYSIKAWREICSGSDLVI
jgi:hypothetical protein